MSNTYGTIKKEVVDMRPDGTIYTTKMELSLTAFVGRPEVVQLTIQTRGDMPTLSGCGYITLSPEEIDKLIFALLERKLKIITATGNEQSQIIPDEG